MDRFNVQNSAQGGGIKKILFLLNLLTKRALNKKEILEEFTKNDYNVSKTSLDHYIEVLKANEIELEVQKEKNKNIYFVKEPKTYIDFTQKELSAIDDIKKLLRLERNYTIIRQAMALFYKLAIHIKDFETRLNLINFGYYSGINWNLVKQLDKHCRQKDIITLDYMLPDKTNRFITLHVDSIKPSQTSERLYLHGTFENARQFSKLPIDRIFMVEKVKRRNVRFDLETELLTYKISRSLYENIEKDSLEIAVQKNNRFVTIKRPVDNEFEIVQKLLSYCPDLYHISNPDIANAVIEKLRIIRAKYDKQYD